MGCVSAPTRGWSGPVVSDNVLYIGTIEDKIIALDLTKAEDGGPQFKWEKELEKVKAGGFGCSGGISTPMSTYGTPVVADGEVYLGGYDGTVYAFSVENGARNDFDTGSAIGGSPVVANGTVFVGNTDGKLYALAADNIRNEKWAEPFETEGKIWSTPVVHNGVVYVSSSDNRLYAVNAESGQEIWHFEAEAAILSTPLVDGDTVYIGAGDWKFYAIDVEQEGTEAKAKWVFEEAKSIYWTKALIHNGEIWVGNLDYNIYVIDAEDGGYIWKYETEGRVRTPPVLVNEDIIVIGSEDGNVYTLEPKNKKGSELRNLEGPILAPIYADTENGIIYVHAQNGDHMLYAIKVETNTVIWNYATE